MGQDNSLDNGSRIILYHRKKSFFNDKTRTYDLEMGTNTLIQSKLDIRANYGRIGIKDGAEGHLQGIFVVDKGIWSLWANQSGNPLGWEKENSTKISKKRNIKPGDLFNGDQLDLYTIERIVRSNFSKEITL